jgi:hypothetical protein
MFIYFLLLFRKSEYNIVGGTHYDAMANIEDKDCGLYNIDKDMWYLRVAIDEVDYCNE